MKKPLNLSIRPQTHRQAREWARIHQVSLSELVDSFLAEHTQPKGTSFSETWRGKFPVMNEGENSRGAYLRDRYGL